MNRKLFSEPRHVQGEIEPVMSLMIYTRGFFSSVTTLAEHMREFSDKYQFTELKQLADTIVQILENLVDAVRQRQPPQPLPDLNSYLEPIHDQIEQLHTARDAMKSLSGGGEAVKQGIITPQEAIRYAMSLPIAILVSGINSLDVLRQNLAIARSFQPMTEPQMQALRDRVAQYATDGRFELFKSSKKYDADEGRIQHGFPPQQQMPT
ncbi:hypothetical protein AB0758_45465 [Tolypothrix bouteillei VB521301_2]|uniref:hypothetical protein n=1 Tax=Tolypothrix bouteillei TaxID=1246981 RepID=UPI000513B88E